MRVDERALHEAAQDIFTSLGPLNDLGAELSNTVANVYYRFHVMSQNIANPGEALGVKSSRDMRSNFRNLTAAMGIAVNEYKFIAKIIGSLREARAQNPGIGDFLIIHALDEFKYHIKNAHKKSLIRRSIERPFCKVDEIAGLYDRMAQVRGATQGSSTRNYFVVVFVKKAEQFEKAAAELMSTANRPCELYDDGDSGVFRFSFETQSEAEALHLKLAHFPKKYGSILLLQNPLA
jgi:hypothetical protein